MPRRRNRSPASDDSTQPSTDHTQSDKEVRKSAKKGKGKETYEDAFLRMASEMKKVQIGTYRLRVLPERKEKERRRTHSEPTPRHHARSVTPNQSPSPHRDESEDEYVNLSPVKNTGKKRRSKKRKSISLDTRGIKPKDPSQWRSVGPESPGELSGEPDSDTSLVDRKKIPRKQTKKPVKKKEENRMKTTTPKSEKKSVGDKKPKHK